MLCYRRSDERYVYVLITDMNLCKMLHLWYMNVMWIKFWIVPLERTLDKIDDIPHACMRLYIFILKTYRLKCVLVGWSQFKEINKINQKRETILRHMNSVFHLVWTTVYGDFFSRSSGKPQPPLLWNSFLVPSRHIEGFHLTYWNKLPCICSPVHAFWIILMNASKKRRLHCTSLVASGH